jgi:SAM-dependent methyltransferase
VLGRQVLGRFRQASMATRLFLNARWRWTPYEQIAARIPAQGAILDLGSGHGLLSLALGLSSPQRKTHGIDHDPERVALAQKAAAGLPNLTFATGSLLEALVGGTHGGNLAAIVCVDAVHYLSYDEQLLFLAHARKALRPGGVLLIRDVDAGAGKTFFINRIYEQTMTAFGFTRADRLNFRRRSEWHEVLASAGFEPTSEKCSRFPFADLLFVCKACAVQAQATLAA